MPKSLAERTGAALRAFRVDQGLTLKEVAGRAGMKPPSISDIESGRANLTLERLERIAKAYNVDIVFDLVRTLPPPSVQEAAHA